VELGVAGYPGDRDFGEFMYEHWATVDIDLAKTNTLLSYKIDTMPGVTLLILT
jgi:V8-like Glu-specific endopeptidase